MDNQKKILVVEDEAAYRRVLMDKFSKEGFLVVEAADGEDALNKATAERPDLITLDINMPKLDGISFLQQIRAMDEWGLKVEVFILTNLPFSEEAKRKQEENIGAEHIHYFEKAEIKVVDLVKEIKNILGVDDIPR